jgi:tetratricopeptide (TPR) repeat protein
VSWFEGDFEAGIAPMLRGLEVGGDAPIWRWQWGYLLALLGRLDEATEEAERIGALEPKGLYTLQLLALTAALNGDRDAARAHLAGIDSNHSDHHHTFHVAECYAVMGDLEYAATLVEAAIERGFFPYAFIALHNPFMRPLRGVPRYEEAVREAKRKWQEFRG